MIMSDGRGSETLRVKATRRLEAVRLVQNLTDCTITEETISQSFDLELNVSELAHQTIFIHQSFGN